MALNKNLSDDFFCEYFKWLFKKRKKKKTETQTLFLTRVFVCVCVCVATSIMETQLILHSHRKNINAYKIGHFHQ